MNLSQCKWGDIIKKMDRLRKIKKETQMKTNENSLDYAIKSSLQE